MTDEQIKAHVRQQFWKDMGWFIVGAPLGTMLSIAAIALAGDRFGNAVISAYAGFMGVGIAAASSWFSEKHDLPSTVETARQEIKVFGPAVGYAYLHRRSQKRYVVVCCAIDKRSCRAMVVYRNDDGEVFTRTLKDWREKDDRGTPRFIGL